MIVGIARIGASFYFVWLENNLNRSNPREGLSGDLWAIHGGGIYHGEIQARPPQMPENLHWFKWEAYTTAVGRRPAAGGLLPQPEPVPDRTGQRADARHRGGDRLRLADRQLVRLRPAVRLAAGQDPRAARHGAVRASDRRLLGLFADLQRPRGLHPHRRADGHHHGRQRVPHHHAGPARLVAAIEQNRTPDPVLPARACCARGTTTTSPCRCCSS